MKKLLVLLVIVAIYLNRSYAQFYDFLNQAHLTTPVHDTTIIVGNQSGVNPIKYLALGDSLTAGVGVSDYKNSYPYLLAEKLSLKNNVELTNLAHAGDTSSDLLTTLPKVLSLKPDLITVLIGVNDIHNLKSLSEFENNYIQIVSALKKTNAKIYLLSIPYLGSEKIVYFPYNFILEFRTKQFNNVIKKISLDNQVTFIDLNASKKPANFYSLDQFHPGKAGYQVWSEVINVN